MSLLRKSSLAAEGALQVSRWVKIHVLIDAEEMHSLFETIGIFHLFQVHTICAQNQEKIDVAQFLQDYKTYIASLKTGGVWERGRLIHHFSPILTCTPDVLYVIPVEPQGVLVKATRPVIQLQPYFFQYDNALRSMPFGPDSIQWGIQFSYPSLYQDNKTHGIHPVRDTEAFPNTIVFRTLQRWVRTATLPTPLITEKGQQTLPIRLGKKCFSWIQNHRQLQEKNMRIGVFNT